MTSPRVSGTGFVRKRCSISGVRVAGLSALIARWKAFLRSVLRQKVECVCIVAGAGRCLSARVRAVTSGPWSWRRSRVRVRVLAAWCRTRRRPQAKRGRCRGRSRADVRGPGCDVVGGGAGALGGGVRLGVGQAAAEAGAGSRAARRGERSGGRRARASASRLRPASRRRRVGRLRFGSGCTPPTEEGVCGRSGFVDGWGVGAGMRPGRRVAEQEQGRGLIGQPGQQNGDRPGRRSPFPRSNRVGGGTWCRSRRYGRTSAGSSRRARAARTGAGCPGGSPVGGDR